jgi:hypothetical protein
VDTVLGLFGLLKDIDTEGNLVLAGRATVQRVFAAAEVATVGEIHAVLMAFAVLDDSADLGLGPTSNGYGERTVSQAADGELMPLRGR